jgi:predicted CXXCH cytochrome family protein
MKANRKLPALLVLLVAVVVLVLLFSRAPSVRQPIAFNHRLHTEEVGVECGECHLYFEAGAHSGLPDGEICAGCHEEPMTESAEEAKLLGLIESGEGVTFRKLFRLADHVYYSHARHVGVAELECAECHGAIAQTTTPPSRPLVRVDMDFCTGCHERLGVTNDCIACHR